MAARNYVAFESGKYKQRPSNLDTVDFVALRLGVSNLEISETDGALDFNGARLRNVLGPLIGSDVANKAYVDSLAAGLDPKPAAYVATTEDLDAVYDNGVSGVGATLTANEDGVIEIDGVGLSLNHRVLVKDQDNAEENGVYYVSDVGGEEAPFVLTRAIDFDGSPLGEIDGGEYLFVIAGTVHHDQGFVVSSPDEPAIVGTTDITFQLFSSSLVPTASSAPGGGSLGKVTADENKGLVIVEGVLEVKLAVSGGLDFDFDEAGAIRVVAADSTIDVSADGVKVNFTETFTNSDGNTVDARDIVYVKADGTIAKALASIAFTPGTIIGIAAAEIADSAGGPVYVRPGAKIGGFTSLTISAPVYVSRSSAGGYQQDLSGFQPGEHVLRVGYAISATEVQLDPEYVIEF